MGNIRGEWGRGMSAAGCLKILLKFYEESIYFMEVVKIADGDKWKYEDLLLLADEQMSMIEKYVYRGEMFVLYDGGVRSCCVVTQEGQDIFEIKNIATLPQYQRQGYGRYLIEYIIGYYQNDARELYVGTGDSPVTLNFYIKCGFVLSHVVKNFFIDNYDHPIYEDGKQLVDMIYLKRVIS